VFWSVLFFDITGERLNWSSQDSIELVSFACLIHGFFHHCLGQCRENGLVSVDLVLGQAPEQGVKCVERLWIILCGKFTLVIGNVIFSPN